MPRSLSTLLAIVMMVSAGCTAGGANALVPQAACEIALDYAMVFRSEASRPIAVMRRPYPLAPSRQEIEAFLRQNPDLRTDPDLTLSLAEADIREVSVVESCPALQNWLNEAEILHDDQLITKITLRSEWPVDVLAMSTPALSSDNSIAQFYTSEDSGHLAGALYAVTYRKAANGHWVLLDKRMVAIS